MKRRLDNWLDRIFDRANPITVRDSLGSFGLAALAPIYLLIVLGLYFFTPRELDYEFVTILGSGGWLIAFLLATFTPLHGLWKARIEDELLSLTPMTPAAQVRGYLTTPVVMATASVFYFASYPFFRNEEFYNKNIDNVPLLMLYSFLFFLALPTYFFSFHARVTVNGQQYVAFFCAMFGLAFMLIPSLAVLHHPSTPNFRLVRSAGFLFYWAFIPGIMATIALAGYLLSLYHFSRPRKPFWRSIAVNWFVCLMLGGFYAIIVFVAHLLRILSPFGS